MGVTVTKGKAKAVEVPATKGKAKSNVDGAIADMVDRIAELAKQMAPFAELAKEQAALEKHLKALAEDKPDEEVATFVGTEFNYVLSEKANQRRILDMADVKSEMGTKLFMECATVTLADIDKYMSEEQKEKLLAEARTGSRRGKLVPKN